MFQGDTHTILHKFSLSKKVQYQTSTLVPGVPQTQYAMSSLGDDFSMVMQRYAPERATDVYVLGSDLELVGSILSIAP